MCVWIQETSEPHNLLHRGDLDEGRSYNFNFQMYLVFFVTRSKATSRT